MKQDPRLEQLSLLEKAALLSGETFWASRGLPEHGIARIEFSDGPNGVRKQKGNGDHLGLNEAVKATCFPTGATLANSWDPELIEQVGAAIGREAAANDITVLLGPGMNLKRDPLCGRSFEYFSEDPYLSGKAAAAYVRGVQREGVSACVKHFAVNSRETRRMVTDAVVDERTLRELYLTGFEIAVREGGPGCLMTAYNMVNGTYANENTHLLRDILRGEWGYEGLIVTDWGGSNDHVAGIRAGSDIEMPTTGISAAYEVAEAVRAGRLTEREVDECAARVLAMADRASGARHADEPDRDAQHRLCEQAARECAVLLRNENGLLPLRSGTKVAIIGDMAFEPRYQGGGSSNVNARIVDSFISYREALPWRVVGAERGYRPDGRPDPVLRDAARAAARLAEVVLFFFGLPDGCETEGLDRPHMRIPDDQIALLKAIRATGTPVVGILSAGSAVEMPWAELTDALLYVGLGGEAAAAALPELLTGESVPCGHLSETIPLMFADTPAAGYSDRECDVLEYREGLYVGYRYYSTIGREVRFPFGFGLSYTEFAYSELSITDTGVSFTVTNTGRWQGVAVPQLYVSLPDSALYRPRRELKGFARVTLFPGERRQVCLPFDAYTFRVWNPAAGAWCTEAGTYLLELCTDAQTPVLSAEHHVAGVGPQPADDRQRLPHYRTGDIKQISDEEYSALMGGLPEHRESSDCLTMRSTLSELEHARSALARLIGRQLRKRREAALRAGRPELELLFLFDMPFRGIAKLTGGSVSPETVQGLLDAANGRLLRGLLRAARSYRRTKRLERQGLHSAGGRGEEK